MVQLLVLFGQGQRHAELRTFARSIAVHVDMPPVIARPDFTAQAFHGFGMDVGPLGIIEMHRLPIRQSISDGFTVCRRERRGEQSEAERYGKHD